MQSKRIMIIGCGGSGKSTLARNLGKKMNIPVIHLDKLYWRSGWNPISDDEFDILLHHELKKDSWIMDGNFNRTVNVRLNKCDTVIYLDYSRITCLIGVLKRVLSNYGKTRSDMSDNCPEKFDMEFFKWIWTFNKTFRNKYYEILSNTKDKRVIIVHNRKEAKDLFK